MAHFKHHIFICGNCRPEGHPRGCCDPEGQEALRTAFKREIRSRRLRATVRANRAGCLDQCEHGPCVVIYPEGVWYGRVGLDDIGEILDRHIEEGQVVERLQIPDECVNNPNCPHRKNTGERVEAWKKEKLQESNEPHSQ